MGLNRGDMDHCKSSKIRAWALPAIVIVLATAIALAGDLGRDVFGYDRMAIAGGEWWRLASGHFAHLGWSHFAMNVVGFVLISYLVAGCYKGKEWLAIGAIVVLGIDLGFWFFQPQLIWYVGLSGVLHGLLAAGTVSGLRSAHKEFQLIAAFLVGKLLYEQLIGPLPGSESTAGGGVIVAAHIYGAISGALMGLLICFRKAPPASI
jgi:rhomboid family GlyGly-CTERM serine protease